eukprot:scaffold142814_cov14-Tisochrysis_lutea.AAC.1
MLAIYASGPPPPAYAYADACPPLYAWASDEQKKWSEMHSMWSEDGADLSASLDRSARTRKFPHRRYLKMISFEAELCNCSRASRVTIRHMHQESPIKWRPALFLSTLAHVYTAGFDNRFIDHDCACSQTG